MVSFIKKNFFILRYACYGSSEQLSQKSFNKISRKLYKTKGEIVLEIKKLISSLEQLAFSNDSKIKFGILSNVKLKISGPFMCKYFKFRSSKFFLSLTSLYFKSFPYD